MTTPNAPSNNSDPAREPSAFEAGAGQKQRGLLAEFWQFVRHTRSWWLIPIAIAVLLFGFALVVGTGPLAPLLYALF